jgi:Endonuclease-reverse transcriptase
MLWLGDFNRHHPLWDEERNTHLFTAANLDAAQPLLNLLAAHNMKMALPKNIPMLEAMNTKNYTRPDNVFCSADLLDSFTRCDTDPESRPPNTDHLPIISEINAELPLSTTAARLNYRDTDWACFTKRLEALLAALPPPAVIQTVEDFNTTVSSLTQAIDTTIQELVPASRLSPFSKRWWTRDLMQAKARARKAGRASYTNRTHQDHPAHELYRIARNAYSQLIKRTKQEHWVGWLEEVNDHSVWTANHLVSGPSSDGGRVRIQALRKKEADGSFTEIRENAEKSKLLYECFFPPPNQRSAAPLDPAYPPPSIHI